MNIEFGDVTELGENEVVFLNEGVWITLKWTEHTLWRAHVLLAIKQAIRIYMLQFWRCFYSNWSKRECTNIEFGDVTKI